MNKSFWKMHYGIGVNHNITFRSVFFASFKRKRVRQRLCDIQKKQMENINGIKQREELTVSRKFDVRTMLAKCERHKMAQKQNRHLTPLRKTEHECAARGYFDLNCLSSVVCLLGNDFVVFRVLFTCFFVCLFICLFYCSVVLK